MGRKGQYPGNFGEPHSNGTYFNVVTGLFIAPIPALVACAWMINITGSGEVGAIFGLIIFGLIEFACIKNDDAGLFD